MPWVIGNVVWRREEPSVDCPLFVNDFEDAKVAVGSKVVAGYLLSENKNGRIERPFFNLSQFLTIR